MVTLAAAIGVAATIACAGARGATEDVALNHWHTLSTVAEGDQFTVALDKTWLFTVWDRTFSDDGRIGLWTEEDNVTRFD